MYPAQVLSWSFLHVGWLSCWGSTEVQVESGILMKFSVLFQVLVFLGQRRVNEQLHDGQLLLRISGLCVPNSCLGVLDETVVVVVVVVGQAFSDRSRPADDNHGDSRRRSESGAAAQDTECAKCAAGRRRGGRGGAAVGDRAANVCVPGHVRGVSARVAQWIVGENPDGAAAHVG